MKLEIKDYVDQAGLSQQLLQLKVHTKLKLVNFILYPNNNLLIVKPILRDVMGAQQDMLSIVQKNIPYNIDLITLTPVKNMLIASIYLIKAYGLMDTKLLKVIPPLNLKLQFQFNLFPSKFRLTKMYLHNTLEES